MVQKGFNILIAFLCAVVFVEMNYMFFSSYSFSAITFESNVNERDIDRELEDIWSYKLNLTSKFIPITDKEINLFSKLRSIQVNKSNFFCKTNFLIKNLNINTLDKVCFYIIDN